MIKKIKIVFIASILIGSFSYSYAGWFNSESSYDKALSAIQHNDNINAAKLYEQSCGEGDMHGCFESGNMYQDGRGVMQDGDKASEFYAKACTLRHFVACEKPKLISTYKNVLTNCNAGNLDWCGQLGILYYRGEGIAQDYKLAKKYLTESCNAGVTNSCAWLGNMYYQGLGVEKDYFQAMEFSNKACAAGISASCNDVGRLFKNGQGTRLDLTKAADFYGKACDMQNQQGCENYQQLKSPQPIQQAVNNTPNSNYQQEQLNIQRQQLKLQQEQNLQNQLNSIQQQNQFQSQQNAEMLREINKPMRRY